MTDSAPREITLENFWETCQAERGVPLTRDMLDQGVNTVMNPTFVRRTIAVGELLNRRTASAWDLDTRGHWIRPGAESDSRTPLLFDQLLQSDNLLDEIRQFLENERAHHPPRDRPRAIALHCSSCNSRWMLDGNHGFLRLCLAGDPEVTLTLTEMSSSDWKGLHRVCSCPGGA